VNGGDALSVPGGNVALTASHAPDDRGGNLEGGGVSTHAQLARRSTWLANRERNPPVSNPVPDSQPNQAFTQTVGEEVLPQIPRSA
jgi:hypothetical protein